MSNGLVSNPPSIYEFQCDIFDKSHEILKTKVNNGKNLSKDECFDLLISIKDLEKEIKMHEKEITVCVLQVHVACL